MAWALYRLSTEPGLIDKIAREACSLAGKGGEIDPLKLQHAGVSAKFAHETLHFSAQDMQSDQNFWKEPLKRHAYIGASFGFLELQLFALELACAYQIKIFPETPMADPAHVSLPPKITLQIKPRMTLTQGAIA